MLASELREGLIGKSEIQPEARCRFFSLSEIQSATNNFDDKLVLGIGGFGKVYKGFIDDGATAVAVKRLKPESNQGADEFWMEVRMLSELRHPNLVVLIGYCNDRGEMILVYEYVAHGTLADHLYKNRDGEIGLSWEQRLKICIGSALGLDYMHTGTEQSFIHRDVKTENILLDQNWVAKIADFGLSKGTTNLSKTHLTTNVKGTFGFVDPDYFMTQRLTKKSDVYAFGVVMLEALCGRPAVDPRRGEDRISLVFWTQDCIKKGRLYDAIDPGLRGQIVQNALSWFMEIATKCVLDRPQGRPMMAEVVSGLKQALLWQQSGMVAEKEKEHQNQGTLPPQTKKKGKGISWTKQIGMTIDATVKQFTESLPRSFEFRIGLPEDNNPNSYNYGRRPGAISQSYNNVRPGHAPYHSTSVSAATTTTTSDSEVGLLAKHSTF